MIKKEMKYAREFYILQAKMTAMDKRKQILASQLSITEKALEELLKTTEKEVYQIFGNVLIKKDVQLVINDMREKKNSMASQLKTIEENLSEDMIKLQQLGGAFNKARHGNLNSYYFSNDENNESLFDIAKIMKETDNKS
jgi:chaperonin cofactor prefoldin